MWKIIRYDGDGCVSIKYLNNGFMLVRSESKREKDLTEKEAKALEFARDARELSEYNSSEDIGLMYRE